jgi:hypothetical protein
MKVKPVSPDEIMIAAIAAMLQGKPPEDHFEWSMLMNFIAANLAPETCLDACLLMALIYDFPLEYSEIESIVMFQISHPQNKRSEKS